MAPERWVWLARIKRTQGRKGEVFAEILTDFPEKFSQRRRLWLLRKTTSAHDSGGHPAPSDTGENPREVELVKHWPNKGGIVLHFAGTDSISAAEELAGCIVAIPQSERAHLDEGDFYIGDLIGCAVVDVAASQHVLIGEIEEVDRNAGPVAMLVVRPPENQSSESTKQSGRDDEILIPFAKEYLRRVDLHAKSVEMALPQGLLEINDPKRS
jgi:16S rRNA processing protein RimM